MVTASSVLEMLKLEAHEVSEGMDDEQIMLESRVDWWPAKLAKGSDVNEHQGLMDNNVLKPTAEVPSADDQELNGSGVEWCGGARLEIGPSGSGKVQAEGRRAARGDHVLSRITDWPGGGKLEEEHWIAMCGGRHVCTLRSTPSS